VIAAVADDDGAGVVEDLRAALPDGVDLRVLPRGGGDLDGVGFLVPDAFADEGLPQLKHARQLEVVQVLSAGTDWIERHVPPWAALCNARGARDVPVAEWVVGALLGAATGLLAGVRRGRWEAGVEPAELAGSTVVVLGHGSIGEAVRVRLEPLGVRVVGVARRARAGVHAVGELPGLLAEADALVVLAPLTEATRGLVDAAVLGALRDGALVVNAGRGAVVDTDALLAELQAGRLRAVLDVTDPEPLPEGHPLWSLPNCVVTPHIGNTREMAEPLLSARIAENVRRWAAGEELLGPVDPDLGY
jgi:phosphoglycerate dehydrogenase-like enzyme